MNLEGQKMVGFGIRRGVFYHLSKMGGGVRGQK